MECMKRLSCTWNCEGCASAKTLACATGTNSRKSGTRGRDRAREDGGSRAEGGDSEFVDHNDVTEGNQTQLPSIINLVEGDVQRRDHRLKLGRPRADVNNEDEGVRLQCRWRHGSSTGGGSRHRLFMRGAVLSRVRLQLRAHRVLHLPRLVRPPAKHTCPLDPVCRLDGFAVIVEVGTAVIAASRSAPNTRQG